MQTLTETGRKNFNWKQLAMRCANPDCPGGSRLAGMLNRVTGLWLNGERWYCSPACLQEALEEMLMDYYFAQTRPVSVRTTMPMGLMMLSREIVDEEQLKEALALQRQNGERIGVCLQQVAGVSYDDIASVVAAQWAVPLFPSESVQPACVSLVPLSLIERYEMAPVHLVSQGRRLFVGFACRVNHTLLAALEDMLHCQTEACILPEPALVKLIARRKRDARGETAVHRPKTPAECARMILSYAAQTGAHTLRVREFEGNIWVRYQSSRTHLDLVFEIDSRHN